MINKLIQYIKFKYEVYKFCNEVSRLFYDEGYPFHAFINSVTALMYLSMIPKLGCTFEEHIASPLMRYVNGDD